MNKKGFTIVELAIALVVIGIILTMTVISMSIFDAALMKRELSKFRKLETALATHYAASSNFPKLDKNDTNFVRLDPQVMITRGLLTKDDLLDKYTEPSVNSSGVEVYNGYAFYLAKENRNAANVVISYVHDRFGRNAIIAGFTPSLGLGAFGSQHDISKAIVCNYEATVDDQDYSKGKGRINVNGGSDKSVNNLDFKDCSNADFEVKMKAYGILIFKR